MNKHHIGPGIYALIAISAVLLGCNKLTTPMPDSDLIKYQGCISASDCVYANNGCCDCANGGQAIAINSAMTEDFLAQFDCTEIACTLIARIPPCESGTASCEGNLCTYELP